MSVAPSTKTREAGSQRPARRPTGRRLSATHILIAVVVILAFVLNLLVLQDRSESTLVAMANRPLAVGSTFDSGSLSLVAVDSDFEALASLLTEGDLSSLEGWVWGRSIPEGAVVDRYALVEPGSPSGLRTMSVPVSREHAAGGSLVAGDRVDVISVTEGVASFVASDLEVTGVAEEATGAIGSSASYYVILALEATDALRLAEAIEAGSVEMIRSTGAPAIDGEAASE